MSTWPLSLWKKRNKVLLIPLFCFLVWFNTENLYGQSCTATDFGTVGSTITCLDFDATPSGSGSTASCTGSGFGGTGTARIIRFCTNASPQCVSFDITGLAGASGTEITLWTSCTSGTLSGYVSGSANCYSGAASVGWSSAGLGLSANTCYYMRVWTKNPPTSSALICANTQSASNDFCASPLTIGTVPATRDNYCMTAGTPGDPAPSEFCAITLENNAWFGFTTLPTCSFPCTVTIDITGIACSGGGNGFQIGWWTGSCGSLSSIGCVSGAGGSVTATINNLSPSQTLLVGLDGNAGAFCNFSIAGTNIAALPVGFIDFYGSRSAYGVALKWQTLEEADNAYFTIERSADNQNWAEIYRKNVPPTSQGLKDYAYTDETAESGIQYYRLTQTGINGNRTLLKSISFEGYTAPGRIRIIPNPVSSGTAAISVDSDEDTDGGLFIIIDSQGKVLYTKQSDLVRGTNLVPLEYGGLQQGVYYLEFVHAGIKETTKFIQL